MKNALLTILTLLSLSGMAQDTATWESFLSNRDSFLNGKTTAPQHRKFNDKGIEVKAVYDTSFGGYWKTGFAVSSMTDTTTGTSANLYSAITGTGAQGTEAYLVGNPSGNSTVGMKYTKVSPGGSSFRSLYVTNTTYAYRVMKNGNQFSRKFTGKNKDSFVLVMYGFSSGTLVDSAKVYLADFTHADSSNNYILKEWKKVDFSFFSDSISFKMVSSDVGNFGINTPTFFALDQITVNHSASLARLSSAKVIKMYPNPATSSITIMDQSPVRSAEVLDVSGRLLIINQTSNSINIGELDAGCYLLRVIFEDGTYGTQRFIKK